MLTIIASIVGFLGSLVPDVMRIISESKEKSHELKMLDMQIQIQKQKRNDQNVTRLEEAKMRQATKETKFLYGTYYSNNKFIDALNASVRPVLAYSFFLIYVASKVMQFFILDAQTADFIIKMEEAIKLLWAEEDQVIFAGVISFYYGQRSFAKLKK